MGICIEWRTPCMAAAAYTYYHLECLILSQWSPDGLIRLSGYPVHAPNGTCSGCGKGFGESQEDKFERQETMVLQAVARGKLMSRGKVLSLARKEGR